jgi:hypothetical protein
MYGRAKNGAHFRWSVRIHPMVSATPGLIIG